MSAPPPGGTASTVRINRAPVLTLWAAVVAERIGFDPDEAATLGRAVAGLNAYSKGVRLGIFQPRTGEPREKKAALRKGEVLHVDLLQRAVPAQSTPEGIRALSKDRPISPESVRTYLAGKFGDSLEAVKEAMEDLARSLGPEELAERGFELYEAFRPEVPRGKRGWGAAGVLRIDRIRALID